MYVVMNVVNVSEEKREAFENAFTGGESHVAGAEGFAGFELLRRDSEGEYIVLSRWQDEDAFKAWRESDLFKKSHGRSDGNMADSSSVRKYDVVETRTPA